MAIFERSFWVLVSFFCFLSLWALENVTLNSIIPGVYLSVHISSRPGARRRYRARVEIVIFS